MDKEERFPTVEMSFIFMQRWSMSDVQREKDHLEFSPKRRDKRRDIGDNGSVYLRNYHNPMDFKIILRNIVYKSLELGFPELFDQVIKTINLCIFVSLWLSRIIETQKIDIILIFKL